MKELKQKLWLSRPDVQVFPGTWAGVFQKVHDWIDDPDGPNMIWLSAHLTVVTFPY
jgi:hypothetical protein